MSNKHGTTQPGITYTEKDYSILASFFVKEYDKIVSHKHQYICLVISIVNIDYTENKWETPYFRSSIADKCDNSISYREEKDNIIISCSVLTSKIKYAIENSSDIRLSKIADDGLHDYLAQAYNSTRTWSDYLYYLHDIKFCTIDKLIYSILYIKRTLAITGHLPIKHITLQSENEIIATVKNKPVAFISKVWAITQLPNYYEQLLCPSSMEPHQCEETRDLYYMPIIYSVLYYNSNKYYIFRKVTSYINIEFSLNHPLNEENAIKDIRTELKEYMAIPLRVFTSIEDCLSYINIIYSPPYP